MKYINILIDFFKNEAVIAFVIDILKAIIISIVTGLILTNAFLKERKLGKRLSSYGIIEAKVDNGRMSNQSQRLLFGLNSNPKPKEVKLCFLTGINFFKDYGDRLENLLIDKDFKLKVLLESIENAYSYKNNWHNEDGTIKEVKIDSLVDYYYDILIGNKEANCYAERSYVMLNHNYFLYGNKKVSHTFDEAINILNNNEDVDSNIISESIVKKNIKDSLENPRFNIQNLGDHVSQVLRVKYMIDEFNNNKKLKGKAELRYYADEYRMPMTIAYYHGETKKSLWYKIKSYFSQDNNEGDLIRLWTNFNAPCKETRDSVNIKAEKSENESANFVSDTISSFDYLWDKYK